MKLPVKEIPFEWRARKWKCRFRRGGERTRSRRRRWRQLYQDYPGDREAAKSFNNSDNN